jgi:3',5'-cyclic AMP phosphodiesterase CpdA
MRTLAHISDLHFGSIDPSVLAPLRAAILANRPDLLVVSGDLTQRARDEQFAAARQFLDTLAVPRIVVPGNHDVPLYDVFTRWLRPLAAYRRHIDENVEPSYADEEIALVGINTARSLILKNGRINRHQVQRGCALLASSPSEVIRIVVTHHPLNLPGVADQNGVVGRAAMAIAGFARCRVDMILSGHLHLSQAAPTPVHYGDTGYSALLIQAGTATSSRLRDEPNSFNVIQVDRPFATVIRHTWDARSASFAETTTDRFRSTSRGWSPLAGEP